jgi:hypothetical protein
MGFKIMLGILFAALAISIYGGVSVLALKGSISQTYKDLPCVAQGKVVIGGDCFGGGECSVGSYPLKQNAVIFCRNGDQIQVTSLRENNCEFLLYKGWNFGTLGDFYYITPK